MDIFRMLMKRTVTTLSEAGYLYYQSVLNVDATIDNSENNRMFETLSLQEQTIKKVILNFRREP